MSLHSLFKAFCSDAFQELRDMKELPRPPSNVPEIAGNVDYTARLSKLGSYIQLKKYMLSSGLYSKLRDVGHGFIWSSDEVFEWLFLERVLAISGNVPMDSMAFKKVFIRAQAEIYRQSYRVRRITVIDGLPKLRKPLTLCKNVVLTSEESHIHHSLPRLLGRQFQDINRIPNLWVDSGNRLLVQTRTIAKDNNGDGLLQAIGLMQIEAEGIMKTLKISLDRQIYPKDVYLSYLSCFPLFPVIRTEFEEFSRYQQTIHEDITRAEILKIRRTLKLINKLVSGKGQEPQFLNTAVDRFSNSFKPRQSQQSIVDLIIALESMLGFSTRSLKQNLASNVAALLGTNEKRRRTFCCHVGAGYDLRSKIVHGSVKIQQQKAICKVLKRFFPNLNGKTDNEVLPYIDKATEELQRIVRLTINAYIYMRHNKTRPSWPKAGEFKQLLLDSTKRRKIQKQLGVTARQPEVPSWHY